MTRLLERADRLDGIVVETSGLALPEPLVAAFGWPEIRSRTRVHGVVTVVDGEALAAGHVVGDAAAVEAQRQADPSLDHISAIEELFADQLGAADLVLVSRADRLEPADLERVKERLKDGLRPGTVVMPMARGRIDPSLVLDGPGRQGHSSDQAAHRHADDHGQAHDHHDHAHVAMESLVVRRFGSWERPRLEAALQRLLIDHPVVRLKGRLRQEGKRMPLQIQAVGRRLDCWYEEREGPSRTAASGGDEAPADLELVLLATEGSTASLRQALERL
jgi:cobalamin biosynthesis protein CobW